MVKKNLIGAKYRLERKYKPEDGIFGKAPVTERDKLSERQKVFCAEYILDFNPTRAYLAAGFTGANPASKAYRILEKPQVQKEIKLQLKRRQEERKMTADRVIEELSKVALADIREIFDDDGNIINPKLMNDTLAASIASIELKTGSPATGTIFLRIKFSLVFPVIENSYESIACFTYWSTFGSIDAPSCCKRKIHPRIIRKIDFLCIKTYPLDVINYLVHTSLLFTSFKPQIIFIITPAYI